MVLVTPFGGALLFYSEHAEMEVAEENRSSLSSMPLSSEILSTVPRGSNVFAPRSESCLLAKVKIVSLIVLAERRN